jgi:MYXO-CTERM domain-containing protein
MDAVPGYLGAFFLLAAGLLALWRKRRMFTRINRFGVERFASFGAKVSARLTEGVAAFAAIFLASAGVLLLAVQFQDSWGWVVLLPVYGLVLFLLIGS